MTEERTRVDITFVNGETTTHTEYGYFKSVRDDIIRDIDDFGYVVFNVDKQSAIINFAHVSSIRLHGYQVGGWQDDQ